MSRPPQEQPRVEAWPTALLLRNLEQSCIEDHPGVVDFDQLPRSIELGMEDHQFGGKVRKLRTLTDRDPDHREFGAAMLWVPEREKVSLPS